MANKAISALTALSTLADGDLFVTVDISDTTQAASGTTKKITASNVAAFVGSFYYNVLDYGAVGDGSTDDHAAIQAAIDAAEAAGGGTVIYPNNHTFEVTTALIPKNKVNHLGLGLNSHLRTSTAGVNLFTFPASDIGNITMYNLKLEAGFTAGHIFDCSAGGQFYWFMDNLNIVLVNPAKCVFYHPAGHILVNSAMRNTYIYVWCGSRTISPFYFVKGSLSFAMNGNVFDKIIFDLDTETVNPAIYLESTASASIFGNKFTNITLEGAAGGYIKMLSTHSTSIDAMWGYDQSAWQSGKSLIVASKSATGGAINNCNLTIINSGLNGSSGVPSGTAQPTIDLDSNCENTTVIGFRNFPDVGVINVGSSVNTQLYNISPSTTINNPSSTSILMQGGIVRGQYINGTDWSTAFTFMGS